MKATELRIGNWVKRNTQLDGFQIDKHSFWTCETHPELYNPIPLTEQWLKDFGFIFRFHNEDDNEVLQLESIKIIFKRTVIYAGIWNFPFKKFKKKIKYVHQLQNLYFALTDKELKKKP